MKVRTNADAVLQYDVIGLTATEMGAILAYLQIASEGMSGRYAAEAKDIADRLESALNDNDYSTQYREVPVTHDDLRALATGNRGTLLDTEVYPAPDYS